MNFAIGQIFFLYQREFAPFPERLPNIIALLKQLPDYLLGARSWVQDPVELWTRKAIASAEGIPTFLQSILARAEGVVAKDTCLKLQQVTERGIEAIKSHKTWLEAKVLPQAKGSWALGADNYEKLLSIKQAPLSIPDMEALAEKVLKETKAQLRRLANELVPGGTVEDAATKVKQDHPSTFEEVVKEYEKALTATREFILDKGLATIPPDEKLRLRETPPFLRPFIPLAAYLDPAKYDPVQEGLFYVTPPGEDGKLLEEHNYGAIGYTTLHEGYPGHHLQAACSLKTASFGKALCECPIETTEGWALYCEWMMEEQGFTLSPAAKFEQLRATLMRAIRVLVDIRMGKGLMSVEEAAAYLVREAYVEKSRALMEAELYTFLPTYFTGYLVGAHQIATLKEKSQTHQGDDFNERAFHDLILSSYFFTIATIEQRMRERGWLPPSLNSH